MSLSTERRLRLSGGSELSHLTAGDSSNRARPVWDKVLAYWEVPTSGNRAAATPQLTFEFIREQYVDGLPAEVAARIEGEPWAENWRIMGLPGRMETQHALIDDYRSHAANFDAIAEYLEKWQPPALMLVGAARSVLRHRRDAGFHPTHP